MAGNGYYEPDNGSNGNGENGSKESWADRYLKSPFYKEAEGKEGEDKSFIMGTHSQEMKEIDRATEVGIDEWGTSSNPFEHQTQALKARIFHGANRVEFVFFGAGKGRKEQATPETYGRRERRES